MAVGSGGQPDVVIGGGGNPGRRTPEYLAELPLGLLREKGYGKLGPEESLRLLSAYERAMEQAPEEVEKQVKQVDIWNSRIKGTLGGAAIAVVAGLGVGVGVGVKSLETHSLVEATRQLLESAPTGMLFLSTVVIISGALGLAYGDGLARERYNKKLYNLEQRIETAHRQDLAAALTGEELDAIYLQASTRLE